MNEGWNKINLSLELPLIFFLTQKIIERLSEIAADKLIVHRLQKSGILEITILFLIESKTKKLCLNQLC